MEFIQQPAGSAGPAGYSPQCKCPAIPDMDPRGGATINLVDDKLIIFGGADRHQTHFNDLWVLEPSAASWKKLHCKGDVPMVRSGHSAVGYGHYLFLFGGIDFAEEAVYNDLYALNLRTWEWSYVGEAGEEICGRNSHSSGVVRDPTSGDAYLVVFGGASPEHGPLGDTYAAKLPRVKDIGDIDEFFVTWCKVTGSADGTHPGRREMQAGCVCGGALYITGGRSVSGDVLTDTWRLAFTGAAEAATQETPSAAGTPAAAAAPAASAESAGAPVLVDITKNFGRHTEGDVHGEPVLHSVGVDAPTRTGTDVASLAWECCRDLQLLEPLCSHVAAATADGHLVLYGGFTGTGIAEGLQFIDVSSADRSAGSGWQHAPPSTTAGVEPRFGASLCAAPTGWAGAGGGVVLFGGVNAEKDCSDVWLFR